MSASRRTLWYCSPAPAAAASVSSIPASLSAAPFSGTVGTVDIILPDEIAAFQEAIDGHGGALLTSAAWLMAGDRVVVATEGYAAGFLWLGADIWTLFSFFLSFSLSPSAIPSRRSALSAPRAPIFFPNPCCRWWNLHCDERVSLCSRIQALPDADVHEVAAYLPTSSPTVRDRALLAQPAHCPRACFEGGGLVPRVTRSTCQGASSWPAAAALLTSPPPPFHRQESLRLIVFTLVQGVYACALVPREEPSPEEEDAQGPSLDDMVAVRWSRLRSAPPSSSPVLSPRHTAHRLP